MNIERFVHWPLTFIHLISNQVMFGILSMPQEEDVWMDGQPEINTSAAQSGQVTMATVNRSDHLCCPQRAPVRCFQKFVFFLHCSELSLEGHRSSDRTGLMLVCVKVKLVQQLIHLSPLDVPLLLNWNQWRAVDGLLLMDETGERVLSVRRSDRPEPLVSLWLLLLKWLALFNQQEEVVISSQGPRSIHHSLPSDWRPHITLKIQWLSLWVYLKILVFSLTVQV